MGENLTDTLRHKSQGAFIIITLVVTVSVGLVFIALLLAFGLRATIAAELQAAADAAALAGASAISAQSGAVSGSAIVPATGTLTGTSRWDAAMKSAIVAIRGHSARGVWGSTRSFAIDEAPTYFPPFEPDESVGPPTWDYSGSINFVASIERGRWLPETAKDPEDRGFISLENPWQSQHYGVPNFMYFNAVRVTLRRTAVRLPWLQSFFDPVFSVEASAVAIGNGVASVQAVPFAIHACALLDNGDFNPENLCLADRLIAATSRHCPAGNPDCGNIPTFSWDPMLSNGTNRNWRSRYWPDRGVNMELSPFTTDQGCFWGTPRYDQPGDNYAIAGIPCHGSTCDIVPAETQVFDLLSGLALNGSAPEPISIGDEFAVLPGGLQSTDTQTLLWNIIINNTPFNALRNAEPHTNFSSSDLIISSSAPNQNINVAFKQLPSARPTACAASAAVNPVANSGFPRPVPPLGWPNGWGGTCNSMRSGWGFWENFSSTPTINFTRAYAPPGVTLPATGYNQHFSTLPIWQPWIAVIADTNVDDDPSHACAGLGTSTSDPTINRPAYEIIGFIQMNVFDVDIGRMPPSYPPIRHPFNAASPRWTFRPGTSPAEFEYMVPAPAPGDPIPMAPPAPNTTYPWAFFQDDGSGNPIYRPCNVVRTRLKCDQDFIPSVSPGSPSLPTPILVR